MLSENAIENLIQPIIDRQEAINRYVIEIIARRVREIGKMSPSDVHRLERLLKSGADVNAINKELAKLTGLQVKDIKALIRNVALDNYVDAKPFYDYRHLSYIPFVKNEQLQRVVKAVEKETLGTYTNLCNSRATGFMIRDLKNPGKLKFYSIKDTYKTVIDEAIQSVQSGIIDYNTAMRRTMEQLNKSGIRRLVYGTGRTLRLDTAVKRNILDGVKAINQHVQDEVGKQYGADGRELSAHPYSAPDHEPFQGRQFTIEEFNKLQSNESFKDIKGHRFKAVERVIGQWNCRHFAFSIILGVSKPNYTENQLKKWQKENARGYTTKDGKHFTMYECRQHLNDIALKVRRAKDGQMMAKECGDAQLAKKYDAKVAKYTQEYNSFAEGCKLPKRREDMYVKGYKKL